LRAIKLSTNAWGGHSPQKLIMALTPLEELNVDLKQRCSNWKEMAKYFSEDYKPDAQYAVFKCGYKVVLKQMLHKNTLRELSVFKMFIDATLEGLDDDTAKYSTGENLKEGTKLNAYNFLRDMNEEYNKLVIYATAIELVPKCRNNHKKIGKHFDVYHEQVKSKLDKMIEEVKEEARTLE
jgi:ubiquitin